MLHTGGDFDKSPGSPTVGLKLQLVQLQFCICPSLMGMKVALAVICQWLIRCSQNSLSVHHYRLTVQLCIYRKMAILGWMLPYLSLQHKPHFLPADYMSRVTTEKTRHDLSLLVLNSCNDGWAKRPVTGCCFFCCAERSAPQAVTHPTVRKATRGAESRNDLLMQPDHDEKQKHM